VLDTSHAAATTVARWRAAGEGGDVEAAVAMVTFGDRRVVPLTRPGARPT
jgi:hypothetical protein